MIIMAGTTEFDIELIRPSRDQRSELLKAQARTDRGKVNACPFCIGFSKLDENGYCFHLIGTTEDKINFEPMRLNVKTRNRVTQCETETVGEVSYYDDETGEPVTEKVLRPRMGKIRKGDVLIRISTSYRVYRDVLNKNRQPIIEMQTKGGDNPDPPNQVAEMMALMKAQELETPIEVNGASGLGGRDQILVSN